MDGRTDGREDRKAKVRRSEPGNQKSTNATNDVTAEFCSSTANLGALSTVGICSFSTRIAGIIIAVQLGAIALDSSTALLHGVNNL
jgi:hypothetical protein